MSTEFKDPKVWQVRLLNFATSTWMTGPNKGQPKEYSAHEALTVVAVSLDRVYAMVRQKYPTARIDSISVSDGNKVVLVDNPIVYEVAERLENA